MKNYFKFRKQNWKDRVKKEKKFNLYFNINPYSTFKARFYTEISSVLILICIKLGIKPNTITSVYLLLGVLGAILLAVPNDTYNILALIVIFSKSAVDWTDGGVAKLTNQTSKFGGLFDAWAGRFGHINFIFGFACYLYVKNNDLYFLFLLIILLISYSTSLKTMSLQMSDLDDPSND